MEGIKPGSYEQACKALRATIYQPRASLALLTQVA